MLAFMDAEFNTFPGPSSVREDQSLIEFALIITDDNLTKEIQTYQSYAKPLLNHGKVYGRIKKLTGITNEDVRNGKTFDEIIQDVNKIVRNFNINKIYGYDLYDKTAMRWNAKQYRQIKNSSFIIKKITDLSVEIRKLLNINQNISVSNLAKICGCEEPPHKALNDARMLWKVYANIKNGTYNTNIIDEYRKYEIEIRYFQQLRHIYENMEKDGLEKDILMTEFVELIKEDKMPKKVSFDNNDGN